MDRQTMILTKDKETQNTIRYAADPSQGPAACRTVYVERWALGTPPPEKLRVILEPLEPGA